MLRQASQAYLGFSSFKALIAEVSKFSRTCRIDARPRIVISWSVWPWRVSSKYTIIHCLFSDMYEEKLHGVMPYHALSLPHEIANFEVYLIFRHTPWAPPGVPWSTKAIGPPWATAILGVSMDPPGLGRHRLFWVGGHLLFHLDPAVVPCSHFITVEQIVKSWSNWIKIRFDRWIN